MDDLKWSRKRPYPFRERDTYTMGDRLQESLKEILNPSHNHSSAKGVDIFGRTKEQVELARLMRAGRKGIRIK